MTTILLIFGGWYVASTIFAFLIFTMREPQYDGDWRDNLFLALVYGWCLPFLGLIDLAKAIRRN